MLRKLYNNTVNKSIEILTGKNIVMEKLYNKLNRKGQTQVEWFLIIALIAAVIIAVFAIFGKNLLSWVQSVLGTITGYSGTNY